MKHALAVIGASYGDEGKGLLTDYLARQGADMVVRFNGGANAGHTVQTDGSPVERHVFHTFGSGTLAGVPTLLSADFIVNPLLIMDEWLALENMGHPHFPAVFVDGDCAITTHYDMLLNQFIERSRGGLRHGSVGVGINETVVRTLAGPAYGLSMRSAARMSGDALRDRLRAIREVVIPMRLTQVLHDPKSEIYQEFMSHVNNEALENHFISSLRALDDITVRCESGRFLQAFDTVIFEGAQGLGLDQHYREGFPHLTRSNTGLKNVLKYISADVALDVHYMTRTYLTRHGAGPLADELPGPPVPNMVDPTNVPHEFQGDLRYAPLDLHGMRHRIHADLYRAYTRDEPVKKFREYLCMTCLDQTGGMIDPEQVADFCGLRLRYTSAGPTAATVHSYNAAHAAAATS